LDIRVLFSDGSSLPLSAVSDSDYSLLVETLNEHIVMLASYRLARLVTVSAVAPGSGQLICVSLVIDNSSCPAVKRPPLVTGFASVNVNFDEMVQSDASYHHADGDHLYSGPFLVSRDRIVYSHSDRSRKGRRRKGKGRSSTGWRGKSAVGGQTSTVAEPQDDDGIMVPYVEAQQQLQDPVIEAPRKSMSSLELAMYILLAVFSMSVIVFAANCLVFVVRRGRKQKLTEPKDPVLEVVSIH